MATVVHFGDNFNWGQEEEKSLRGQRRREEKKQKRKRMAEAKEEQLRLVLMALLDADFHNGVLEVFQSEEWATAVFDSIVKKTQINTEHHRTRSEQLAEFRNVWPRLSNKGKSKFDTSFAAVGLLFERKFGLVDSESSEDEEKVVRKAQLTTQFSTKWFSVNETEDMLGNPVGRLVVHNLRGNFTAREPIFNNEADAQEQSCKEDQVDKKMAATQKRENAKEDEGDKKKASTEKPQTRATTKKSPKRESTKEDEGDKTKASTKKPQKRARKKK